MFLRNSEKNKILQTQNTELHSVPNGKWEVSNNLAINHDDF